MAAVCFGERIGPWVQCLSQELETGCLKLAIVKFLGVQIFKGDHNILEISTINMYQNKA